MNQSTNTAVRTTPGFFASSLRVFDLSLGEMLWSRRTVFMALVVGLPVLLAAIIRLLYELGAPDFRVNNIMLTGPVIFGLMIWMFFVRFSVPVLAVFYGTSLIADEVDDKTITYLFTRPIPRGAVLFGKYLAYLACTIFVVLPSVVVVWLLIVPINGSLGLGFVDLLKDLALLAAGLAVYGAVFSLIGAAIKRPLLVGLFLDIRLGNHCHGASGEPEAAVRRLLPARACPARDAIRFAREHASSPCSWRRRAWSQPLWADYHCGRVAVARGPRRYAAGIRARTIKSGDCVPGPSRRRSRGPGAPLRSAGPRQKARLLSAAPVPVDPSSLSYP